MIKDKKMLPNSRVKLTITSDAAGFRHAFEHELEHFAEHTNIPGFRPGKAPAAKVLEQVGRPRIEAEAIEHAISHSYNDALAEAKLVPVDNPVVSIDKYEVPAEDAADDTVVVTFTAEVDVLPEIKIDGYKKMKIKKAVEKPEVKDDEVEKVLEFLRKQRATLKEADASVVLEMGMWTDIGYVGSVGGVAREDMKNEHHPIVLGEGQLIPGFEEAIVGMKTGEKKTIKLTFPKDYHAKELAGKKAEFDVTVHEVKALELPELNDAFATNYGHDTFAKLKEAIKENLHEEKQQESRQKIEEEVLEELLKIAKFDTPKALVEQEMERMFSESRERLASMNFEWDTYLTQVGKTTAEVREDMRPQAEKSVRIGLALGQVMQEEGIKEQEGGGRLAVDRLVEIATGK